MSSGSLTTAGETAAIERRSKAFSLFEIVARRNINAYFDSETKKYGQRRGNRHGLTITGGLRALKNDARRVDDIGKQLRNRALRHFLAVRDEFGDGRYVEGARDEEVQGAAFEANSVLIIEICG